MSVRSPHALALEWRDALRTRDAGRFADMFAPEGVLLDVEHRTEDLTRTKPIVGRTAIEATTRAWFTSMPEFTYDVVDVLSGPAQAAILWRYELLDESSSLQFEGISWIRCAAGYVEKALVVFDVHELLRRTGRFKDPSPQRTDREDIPLHELAALEGWLDELRLMDLNDAAAFVASERLGL